jgi:opacity protein-like surface antigen
VAVTVTLAPAWPAAAYLDLTPNAQLSESYNDNIYFEPDKTSSTVTRVGVGLGVHYVTQNSNTNLNLGVALAYLPAVNQTTVSIGEGQAFNLATTWQLTPDLELGVYDALGRVGSQRQSFVLGTGTILPPSQQQTDPAVNNPGNVSFILPRDSALNNSFGATLTYFIDPRWSTSLSYGNGITNFQSPNDLQLTQRGGIQLGYQWTPTLSIGPGIQYSRFNNTNAPDSESYTATVGANYQVNEFWNAFGALGGTYTRYLEGPSSSFGSVNFNIGLNRIFEYSILTVGAQQGVTPSAGVAGASQTLGGYLGYTILLTEYLSGTLYTNYTHFDTTTADFGYLTLITGLSYPVWQNIYAGLVYSYIRQDSNQAVQDVLAAGVVDQNAIRLQFSWAEPWWRLEL